MFKVLKLLLFKKWMNGVIYKMIVIYIFWVVNDFLEIYVFFLFRKLRIKMIWSFWIGLCWLVILWSWVCKFFCFYCLIFLIVYLKVVELFVVVVNECRVKCWILLVYFWEWFELDWRGLVDIIFGWLCNWFCCKWVCLKG